MDWIPFAVLLLRVILAVVGVILALFGAVSIINRLLKLANHPAFGESAQMLLTYSFIALAGVTVLLTAFRGHPDESPVDRVNQSLLTFVQLAAWLLSAEIIIGAVILAAGAIWRKRSRKSS